jgi:hypothetical protein
MIYLKEHNVLFLKPRKVAGTSFEIALSAHAVPGDVITPIMKEDEAKRRQLGFRGPQNFRYTAAEALRLSARDKIKTLLDRKMPLKYFKHIPAKTVRERMGATSFDRAFKVSILRNPYDQILSHYFWNNRNSDPREDFVTWLRANPTYLALNNAQYCIDGHEVIDFYIRYEHREEDIRRLESERPALAGLWEVFSNLATKAGVKPSSTRAIDYFGGHPDMAGAVRFFGADQFTRHYDAPL